MATNVDNAILEQFCAITGATNEVGVRLLEACNCNLDMAIGMHMDSNTDGVVTENDQPSTSDYGNDGDEVRAPIPQRSETLVEEMPIYGFRGRRRKTRSVFDGFRDFQAEAKQQEEMLASGSVPSVPNKKRTLEDLFRPPIDITFKGTLASLRDEGKTRNKWLLVNVQNVQEFVCQALNRDVWSNKNAKAVIKDNFIFWQVYHDSEEGKKFCQFYKVNQWPFVAVVDPRTGENMSTWNKLDATVFCELVTDFLMEHPYNDPSEEPSPAAKRARREPSIVDATEDEQLQAAMQASINQNKVPQTVIIDSDSDSNDIETFSGSEDEVSQSPLKSSPNVKSTKLAKEKINDDKTNTDRAKNDQDLKNDSINNISNLSESESSMLNNTGSSDNYCLSEDRNYKHFLGKDTDPQTSLMIRFPDGNRQQLAVSRKSKLMALVLYVAENGFSNERYELVTNFPRRKLSYMDFELTLEDAGLYPQESVFVQAR
ncbi:UBX domain-containing protein 7-like [Mytilus galloprovincialis]|uniref:UBX domain-containing protein 7-like n=1 Tax=Mytilus galloprovincialis TaxID=29158 RepID=UPI003F7C013D